MSECKLRRKKLARLLSDEAIILPSRPVFFRNRDVTHPYRQDSHVFYFTGFEEPGCVFLMVNQKSYMFVEPKNPVKELWEGRLWGKESAKSHFGFDDCFHNHEFLTKGVELLKGCQALYYSFHNNESFDVIFLQLLKKLKQAIGRKGSSLPTVCDPEVLLGEMRLFKSEDEIKILKQACEITSYAHKQVMAHTREGLSERALHGIFLQSIMEKGSDREGYSSIIASGANAICLHYTKNKDVLKKEDWLLVDAGGEYNYYTADVTRSYPVKGKFTGLRKEIYSALLEVQKNIISLIKPGESFEFLHKKTVEKISGILKAFHIVNEPLEVIIEEKLYLKYFPHGLGHWLGSDVHDIGSIALKGESRPFKASMVFTVEPGLYISLTDEKVPQELRGFGLRIEDDLLVTSTGGENLTCKAPKEIRDLEDLIGTA